MRGTRIFCGLLALCLLLTLWTPVLAETPRIILYTAYTQMGWGDRMQAGCVDENGGLWGIEGHDGELNWPYGWEDQIAYLEQCAKVKIGEMSGEDLFDLKGLIACAEPQDVKVRGWMNDAGTETSRAVRYAIGPALDPTLPQAELQSASTNFIAGALESFKARGA